MRGEDRIGLFGSGGPRRQSPVNSTGLQTGTVHLGDPDLQPTNYRVSRLAAMARVPIGLLERLKPETRASVLNQTFPRSRKHKSGLAEGDSLHLRSRVMSRSFQRPGSTRTSSERSR